MYVPQACRIHGHRDCTKCWSCWEDFRAGHQQWETRRSGLLVRAVARRVMRRADRRPWLSAWAMSVLIADRKGQA